MKVFIRHTEKPNVIWILLCKARGNGHKAIAQWDANDGHTIETAKKWIKNHPQYKLTNENQRHHNCLRPKMPNLQNSPIGNSGLRKPDNGQMLSCKRIVILTKSPKKANFSPNYARIIPQCHPDCTKETQDNKAGY